MSSILTSNQKVVPSSKSCLWPLIERFYKQEKIGAWDKVPFVITNCVYLAHQYAQMIRDIQAQTNKKVWVFELGAGVCQLAYYILQRCPDIHMVMCDLRDDLHEFLASHPQWSQVDSSHYDAIIGGQDEMFELMAEVSRDQDAYVVLITNYVIDSLPTDIWIKDKGSFVPAQMIVKGIELECTTVDFEGTSLSFLPDKSGTVVVDYISVLKQSEQFYDRDFLCIPVAAFAIFDRLKSVCGTSATWLIADRPVRQEPEQMAQCGFLRSACWHVGIDFFALISYAQAHDAFVSCDRLDDEEIQVMAISLSHDQTVHGQLADYMRLVQISARVNNLSVTEAVSLLRNYHDDPWLLAKLMPSLLSYIDTSHISHKAWIETINRVVANTYWLPGSMELQYVTSPMQRSTPMCKNQTFLK